ncbi:MAG: ABC transporter ATP-binding protein [Acetobacterium woodii]|nr:ABC transporter ATP-binding protein [Acetobacterium woodii]
MAEPMLQLKNLSVSFDTKNGEVEAVRDVSLTLNKGEILAIVGESGCGKTVMSQSVLKLLPKTSRIKQGRIIVDGEDITDYKEKEMRKLRGGVLSMVFQDPMTTLNPTIPIGKQITESIMKHNKISKEEAKKRGVEMLNLVGINQPEEMFALQPHFFSGGMRQRCVLAIALASNPKILFADEATTALDVTVQAKILNLLLDIRDKTGISIVFISHDLGVVAKIADRVAVMYAGKIVEIGTAADVFYDPRHPYVWGLMAALPSLTKAGACLATIPGMPPVMLNPPPGDAFAVRNKFALAIDYAEMPPMYEISPTHYAATWLLDEKSPQIKRPILLKRMDQ